MSEDEVCDYHDAKTYELDDRSTVADLAKKVGVNPEDVKIIFVNNKTVKMNHVLRDGDKIALTGVQ